MMPNLEAVRFRLGAATAAHEVPGLVAVVGSSAERTLVGAYGVTRWGGTPVTAQTRFDLASLSKVVGTLPSVLALLEDGSLRLDDTLGTFFSQAGWFQSPSLGETTVLCLSL